MNTRFSTQAANADIMGEDTPDAADASSGKLQRQRAGPRERPPPQSATGPDALVRSGKESHAAGPGKDKDGNKP
jgi:hypothetical protein